MKLRKNIISASFAYIIIFIFLYSAFNKMFEFDTFYASLTKSLFIPRTLTDITAYFTIIVEILIAVLLSLDVYRAKGFLLSFSLMFLFTGYVILMVLYSPYLPCSCGGFIESMTWNQHVIFNVLLLIISFLGYLFENSSSYEDAK